MRKMVDRMGRQTRGNTRRLSKQGGGPTGVKAHARRASEWVGDRKVADWLHTRELSKYVEDNRSQILQCWEKKRQKIQKGGKTSMNPVVLM